MRNAKLPPDMRKPVGWKQLACCCRNVTFCLMQEPNTPRVNLSVVQIHDTTGTIIAEKHTRQTLPPAAFERLEQVCALRSSDFADVREAMQWMRASI